jgi:Flp pilus assembly protein protease CpaA
MGGGDAKLLLAIGPYFGAQRVGWLLIATAVAGGALALSVMALRQMRHRPELMRGRKLPYSWAIAVAFAWEAWRYTTASDT